MDGARAGGRERGHFGIGSVKIDGGICQRRVLISKKILAESERRRKGRREGTNDC